MLLVSSSPGTGAEGTTFHFRLLDRAYEAFLTELAPVQIGPAHVELSSPEHRLVIHGHEAVLTPDGSGRHRASVELDLSAAGRIEAHVRLGRIESQIGDDLLVPRQRLQIDGLIELEAAEEGYWITPLELPPDLQVRIESRLASRLFAICHQMALVLVSMDCAALERSLTRVTVPLPSSGESYLLPLEELRPEDRQSLDRYLGAAR